ncbi:MAG: hypothetical protein ABI444_04595, partial [Candidatus Kapaibacterium sp.]
MAQHLASATATASATIIIPISIMRNHDMDFGGLIADPTNPGTVLFNVAPGGTPLTVNNSNSIQQAPHDGVPSGLEIGSVSIINTPQFGTTPQLAVFTVNGQKNQVFAITIPTVVPVTLANQNQAGPTMLLDHFVCVIGNSIGGNPGGA